MEIFKLVGNIMVDSSAAESSISKTGDKADSLASKLGNGVKSAAKWAAGVATAAVAVGTAMVSAAKDVADTAGEIDDAAQRMGVDAESYQKLAYAAQLSGVEMTTMEKAAKSLVDTDMSFDEAMASIMELGTETERTQKAVELFGEKVAYDMQPMLKAGGEAFYDLQEEAEELGAVMSNEAVASGAELGDMFDKITAATSTLKTSLMSELMPYVMEILEWVIEEIPTIKETINNLMDTILPIIQPILEGVMSFIQGIFALINGDTEGFVDGIKGLISGLASGMYQLGEDIFNGLLNGFKAIWSNISNWVSEKVNWIKDMFRGAKSEAEDGTSNSHAAGLPYVPYDNYSANLHRGEMVLTAEDAEAWRNGRSYAGAGSGVTIVQNISAVPQSAVQIASATAAYFERARWAI